MTQDASWFSWSVSAVERAADNFRLVINPVIYAEASVLFRRIEELKAALPTNMFEREPISYEAAFLAGRAYLAYRRRGGTRRSPLPDFFIGAHAAVCGYRLLTRNPARYRAYSSKLLLIAP
jgi:hypothetical protein